MEKYLESLNIDYTNGVIDLNCDPITIGGIVYETPFQLSLINLISNNSTVQGQLLQIESGTLLSRSFDMYEIIDVVPGPYPCKDEIYQSLRTKYNDTAILMIDYIIEPNPEIKLLIGDGYCNIVVDKGMVIPSVTIPYNDVKIFCIDKDCPSREYKIKIVQSLVTAELRTQLASIRDLDFPDGIHCIHEGCVRLCKYKTI